MCGKMRFRSVKSMHFFTFIIGMQMANCQQSTTTRFEAVQSGGVPQCSTDPPSLALRARSRLDCSNLCAQLKGELCAGFNFRQTQTVNCELFNSSALTYSEIAGCTLYQVIFSFSYSSFHKHIYCFRYEN